MAWEKLGLIFSVEKNSEWMYSHASLPIALHLKEDIFRIFFSTRSHKNQSHGAYVDIDLKKPHQILSFSIDPVLRPGGHDEFDCSGVSLSCLVPEQKKMFYLGWDVETRHPYVNQIGIASFDGKAFHKLKNNPLFKKEESSFQSWGYPWVLYQNGLYRIWFDANLEWSQQDIKATKFPLHYAESDDGKDWSFKKITGLELKNEESYISRPCVLYENELYKMWYCVNKNGKYAIGYAQSKDALNWERQDQFVGIATSATGWDDNEICYPFVFNHDGNKYMLYNGNNYGKSGFGLAVWRNEKAYAE